MIQFPPFDIGEIVYFCRAGSGYPKYTRAEIAKIGIYRNDPRSRNAWSCKIKINGKILPDYWSAGWFKIATTRTPKPQ